MYTRLASSTRNSIDEHTTGAAYSLNNANLITYLMKKAEYFFTDTAKRCDMDTLFNEEAASPPGKH